MYSQIKNPPRLRENQLQENPPKKQKKTDKDKKLINMWLTIRQYLSAGGNITIHPGHSNNVEQLEKLIYQIQILPKRIIYHNFSGCCLYNPQTRVVTLYTSPFDVVIQHGQDMISCKSVLWMKHVIDELVNVFQSRDRSLIIIK